MTNWAAPKAGLAAFPDHWPSCKEESRERPPRKARLCKRGPFSGGRSRPADSTPKCSRLPRSDAQVLAGPPLRCGWNASEAARTCLVRACPLPRAMVFREARRLGHQALRGGTAVVMARAALDVAAGASDLCMKPHYASWPARRIVAVQDLQVSPIASLSLRGRG